MTVEETARPSMRPAAGQVDWEQRRYEIAKACVAALMQSQSTLESAAKVSVEQADALIKELRHESDSD